MSVIWIVEKASASGATLAASLMGDFAVRVFASLESFEKLLKVTRSQKPDLLLLDQAGVPWAPARLADFLTRHFHGTPVVCVHPEPVPAVPPGTGRSPILRLQRPPSGLGLSALVDFVLRSSAAGRRGTVRYRDLMLDFERLQCLILPGDDPISLPLKEAQLLKLLLSRPGVCLSRAEISAVLWDGVRVTPRTIDSHVSRLRLRLKGAEVEIHSIYGSGYVLR